MYAVRLATSYVWAPAGPSKPTAPPHEAARTRRRPAHASAPGPGSPADPSAPAVEGRDHRHALVDDINRETDLYRVLGLAQRTSKVEDIRRAYISRSRICHPDKMPDYAEATAAFQKLSYAYETLSRPQSRRLYDLSGRSEYSAAPTGRAASAGFGDETLNGVLQAMLADFIEGDFEMIRVFVNALNEGQPGLNLGDDTVESLEAVMRRLRDVLLAGHRYLRVVKFELMRLYEIQGSLRALSYFDITGRLRLTLQLARVTLAIPMAVDKAMREDAEREALASADPQALSQGRGLLNKRVATMLGFAINVLERGEKIV